MIHAWLTLNFTFIFKFQNLFVCLVVVSIETVKQSLACFNVVQGLFHSHMENAQPKWNGASPAVVESMKTTPMETVSTGLLDENKEHYQGSKDRAEKSYDVWRHIQLHMSIYKKKEENLRSIMWNLKPNCCLKVDFQKVDKHTGGKWLIQE